MRPIPELRTFVHTSAKRCLISYETKVHKAQKPGRQGD